MGAGEGKQEGDFQGLRSRLGHAVECLG
jgi:hypothetical protein